MLLMQTQLHFDQLVYLGLQNPYVKMGYVNRFASRELEEIESECQIQLNGSISDLQTLAHRISCAPDVHDK